MEKYRERFRDTGIFENQVLEGIPQMLKTLKEQGACLAVASSKPEEYVVRILEKFSLAPYFHQVVGASMDESRSAKEDVIREALRRLGVGEREKPRVLMIGDRKHDAQGAKACGIDCLGVYIGFAAPGRAGGGKGFLHRPFRGGDVRFPAGASGEIRGGKLDGKGTDRSTARCFGPWGIPTGCRYWSCCRAGR